MGTKTISAFVTLIALGVALPVRAETTAAEKALSASVVRTERSGPDYTYVLLVVTNNSDQAYASTRWSCVFFSKDQPVFEVTIRSRPRG